MSNYYYDFVNADSQAVTLGAVNIDTVDFADGSVAARAGGAQRASSDIERHPEHQLGSGDVLAADPVSGERGAFAGVRDRGRRLRRAADLYLLDRYQRHCPSQAARAFGRYRLAVDHGLAPQAGAEPSGGVIRQSTAWREAIIRNRCKSPSAPPAALQASASRFLAVGIRPQSRARLPPRRCGRE